ncbi:MAG: DUF5618 family protein [Bacteroidia bacterium]|nr:DUF5618 family protein [Bacteroidia bacterium]
MSIQEQQQLKEKAYNEAMRYMMNAKEQLKKAEKHNNIYKDAKYVRASCGIAYLGVLVALETYARLKDIIPGRNEKKDIEFYQRTITKIDKKLLDVLNAAYDILHKCGYYDGIRDARVISIGFEHAYTIINKIKPFV